MKLILKEYLLELKHTFSIARESRDVQPTLIVKLIDDEFFGLGESTSNIYYNITIKKMISDINNIKPIIENTYNETPLQFWNKLKPYLQDNMFALNALDNAYNDLYSKKQRKKLYETWNLNTALNPITNYTIGIDSIENMLKKINEIPWPVYKIKLGTNNDLEIIKALRKKQMRFLE